MCREVREPLGEIDSVVLLREPRHLTDDGLGELGCLLRTAWFHCPEIILPGSSQRRWTALVRAVQAAVILRRPNQALNILLCFGIRNAVDELVLWQALEF